MTGKTKRIIATIAAEQGIPPEEVEHEMMEAIRAGMASPDPHAQALWKQISPDGKEPSIDRFLEFVSDKAKSKMNQCRSRGKN